jgi:hypothetical protein
MTAPELLLSAQSAQLSDMQSRGELDLQVRETRFSCAFHGLI